MVKNILKSIVFLLVWIVIVGVSWHIAMWLCQLEKFPQYLCYTRTGIEFEFDYRRLIGYEALAVLVCGVILVYRHKWNRLLRKEFRRSYLIYVLTTFACTAYLAYERIFFSYFSIVKALLINCFLPIIAAALLAASVWLMKEIKNTINKGNN